MPLIVQTPIGGPGRFTPVITILTASDDIVYQQGTGQLLVLINNTGGALTPILNGSANSSSFSVSGGPVLVSLTAGHTMTSMAIGTGRAVMLDTIFNMLQGNVTLTAGTGIQCILFGNT